MNRNQLLQAAFFITAIFFLGCNPEPDESNLYTFTGETMADYVSRKPQLKSFNYILNRSRLNRNLAAYGHFTCFAPTNEAVAAYIDSLYHDPEAKILHNGMTENSLEGLSDSLCNDIARFHLCNVAHRTIDLTGGGVSLNTMLGRQVFADGITDSIGRITLERKAVIIEPDSQVTNGIVHVINHVIPRSNRFIVDELERLKEYSIFTEALQKTGLADSLNRWKKDEEYTITDRNDTDGSRLYVPTECKIAYTIFAEPDEVMKRNGINSIDDLIDYANQTYADAASWYHYPAEKGISISTGDDYTNRFNALNMFVAYHILYAGMAEGELVFESKGARTVNMWNYVNGGEPYDYYETMLPNTILKIWQPQPGRTLYINRYQTFNTLTDQLGTMGSSDMHQLVRPGVRITRSSDRASYPTNVQAYNGYIHGLGSMLVYDAMVPRGVLHERMRFESTTFLPEMINNKIRMSTMAEIQALNGGGSGARVAFPLNYFTNIVSYSKGNRLRYNVKGAYRSYQADAMQGWGKYDLAIKLPPLPTGTYEFRLPYTPMNHGGMMQFYLGTSNHVGDMMPIGIPLDVRIPELDPRIGWTPFYEEDDLGVASDIAMRNRGYMRGPFSYMGHPEKNTGNETGQNCRGDNTVSLRLILGRFTINQSEEYWFRIKNVVPEESNLLKWQVDFVEFIPIDVLDNTQYSEDWY